MGPAIRRHAWRVWIRYGEPNQHVGGLCLCNSLRHVCKRLQAVRRTAMRTMLIVILLAATAHAETLPSPERFAVQLSEPVVLTSWTRCTDGYCFKFSNGGVVNETFA